MRVASDLLHCAVLSVRVSVSSFPTVTRALKNLPVFARGVTNGNSIVLTIGSGCLVRRKLGP